MFEVSIEGAVHHLDTVDEVIDQIENDVYFEVDSISLRLDLQHLKEGDTVNLRDDVSIRKVGDE